MFIEFIGVPASGKSTIAAKIFSKLKEENHHCEFILEYARHYIARKKYDNEGKDIILTNEDQLKIFVKQFYLQKVMLGSCPLVITDSSIFNTLLYKDKNYQDSYFRSKIEEHEVDIVFFCYPVKRNNVKDTNRVHSEQFSIDLHKKSLDILKSYTDIDNFIHLDGDVETRFNIAYNTIKERL
ncbi:MAG: AAA family ATPase [Elusimicrobia bacterium]|nr:AAA family ATPase [Elusimicrobiota bacterium]